MGINEELFERAKKTIPGGVNSPVRAFGSVGGAPRFICRAQGPYMFDEAGQRFIDYVLSWGPMILGHNHPAVIEAVQKAVRDGLMAFNPVQELTREERFHAPDKHREYLTADELKRFLAVEPQTFMEEVVQRAFGFSCMTGLRLGDMQRLRWSDIKDVNSVQTVSVIQHKTKRPVAVPLNALALSLLLPRPENGEDGIIFPLVKKPDNVAKYVRRIKNKAGIEKDFTYHSSRHSAATLAITAGAELYSVSKILGHGSIASTQVYAKVNMEKKVEAMNLTNGVF